MTHPRGHGDHGAFFLFFYFVIPINLLPLHLTQLVTANSLSFSFGEIIIIKSHRNKWLFLFANSNLLYTFTTDFNFIVPTFLILKSKKMGYPCITCAPGVPLRPDQACLVSPRKGICVKRFGYISCSSTVDPFMFIGQSEAAVYAALNTMLAVTPQVIGYTGLVAEAIFATPEQLIENNADCLPANITTGSRQITFNDFNAYDVDGSGFDLPYFEYDLFEALNVNGSNYVFFHVDCNNDFWLYYRTVNGDYVALASTFYAFKDMQRDAVGNAVVCKQVIRGTISFIGDPINLAVKPLVNLNNATGALANLT